MHILVQTLITLASALFWIFIDSIKIFNKPICNSAFIHAVVSSVGHTAVCIYQPLILIDYPVIYNNPNDIYLIAPLISFGYSFYDLYIGVKSKKVDNIIHGLLFTFFCVYACYLDMLPLSHIILITETSSIFLNLRPYKSKIFDVLFVTTFFTFRLVIYPALIIVYGLHPNNLYRKRLALGSLGLTMLNAYWFSLIFLKLMKPDAKTQANQANQVNQISEVNQDKDY